jgi:hypothetical protein
MKEYKIESGKLNGVYHRDDGQISYYKNGQLHRDDGPAVIYPNGVERWYQNDKQIDPKIL